ncbi:hypothetical protein IFR05_013846 [Cadophora sp. M221]|nr:hypothetical protein IFR05_013846 [Cadophora sp. M221]
MSQSRPTSDSDNANTWNSWIQLDETDKQWGNETIDSHIPENVRYAEENEQERTLRECMEEMEGRPEEDFDHAFNAGGMGGNDIGDVAHVGGLYPYSMAFPPYLPWLDQSPRAKAVPVAVTPAPPVRSVHEVSSVLQLPLRQPTTPITTASTTVVLQSNARESTISSSPIQEAVRDSRTSQAANTGKEAVSETRRARQTGVTPAKEVIDLTCSPQPNQGGFSPVISHPNSGIIHSTPHRNNRTASPNNYQGENAAHPGFDAAQVATASSFPLQAPPLASFVVPFGFGTTVRVGPQPSEEYPCGNLEYLTRKGFKDKEVLKTYQNNILKANVICKQNGVYFKADGQLQRAASFRNGDNGQTAGNLVAPTVGNGVSSSIPGGATLTQVRQRETVEQHHSGISSRMNRQQSPQEDPINFPAASLQTHPQNVLRHPVNYLIEKPFLFNGRGSTEQATSTYISPFSPQSSKDPSSNTGICRATPPNISSPRGTLAVSNISNKEVERPGAFSGRIEDSYTAQGPEKIDPTQASYPWIQHSSSRDHPRHHTRPSPLPSSLGGYAGFMDSTNQGSGSGNGYGRDSDEAFEENLRWALLNSMRDARAKRKASEISDDDDLDREGTMPAKRARRHDFHS